MRGLLLSLALTASAWGQCPVGYSYQRSITVNSGQVTGTQSNFPMLVLNPTASLKTTGNGGHVTSASGYDVIFVNGSGSTLAFELVGHGTGSTSYSANTGDAQFWVQVASMETGSTVYMCYGNSGVTTYQGDDVATWSGYRAVWHLDEATNAQATDSSGNGFNSTTNVATQAAGKVGNGQSFTSGSSNSLVFAAPNTVAEGDYTISAWLKVDPAVSFGMALDLRNSGNGPVLFTGDTGFPWAEVSFGPAAIESFPITAADNTWHYLVETRSGSTLSVYVDNHAAATGSSSSTTWGDATASIGKDFGGSFYTQLSDETRFLTTALPANWILAEYNNQNDPGSFYAIGAETTPAGPASFTASPTAVPANNSANIVITLTGTDTTWSAETFSISGVSGVTKIAQNIASGTEATLTITTGSSTGTLTISDGSISTTITVGMGGGGTCAVVGAQ